jgi:hypothetical protein
MGKASICLFVGGAIFAIAGGILFQRMYVALNKALPPDKQIPWAGNRISAIRRLYEDSFPDGNLSTIWMILVTAATSLLASGIVAELIRTSK